jgi:hypothetical protein
MKKEMMSLKDIAEKEHKICIKIQFQHKEYIENLNYLTEISNNFPLLLQTAQILIIFKVR